MNSIPISKESGSAKILKTYVPLCVLFLISAILVTYPLFFKMDTAIYGKFYNTDMRGGIWNLWWGKYALFHHLDYNYCPFQAAPFGIDLAQQPVSWIVKYTLAGFLLFVSPVFCFNMLSIVSFILTGVFSYALVYFLTQDKRTSLISAFIFTFSPYHLNKVMEFGFFSFGNWFVLFILMLLMLREKVTSRNIFFGALALGLTIGFNPYYGFFAAIFTCGLFIFSSLFRWKDMSEVKNKWRGIFRFLPSVMAVFLGAALINAPIFMLVLKNTFSSHAPTKQAAAMGFVRSFDYLVSQSARPLSYLLPASTHPVFGDFTKRMFGSIFYGRGSIEQTLYLGWVPLVLSYFAFRQWRYKRLHRDKFPEYALSQENFMIGFFIFSAWLAFVFSMPPSLDLGIFKIYFPSYYFYKILPMFRAYARFGLIVMMCVSVLAGYGLKYIFERLRTNNKRIACAAFVAIAVMFEFINIPPSRVTDLGHIPLVYRWLSRQPGDFIVAEYPMSQGAPGEANENYDYLYYQTIHHKRIVNGALAGTDAFKVREQITKITDSATPHLLRTLGARYVIVHEDIYAQGKFPDGVEVIGEVPQVANVAGYKLLNKFGSDSVYEVIAEPTSWETYVKKN